MEKENLVNEPERDDSKDIVTIDYYDRINKRWIKLDVTKEVARFMRADTQKRRRKQNKYDFHNLPFDEVFDSNKDDNPNNEFLIDENASPDFIMEQKEKAKVEEAMRDEQRTLVENALPTLTPIQSEVVKLIMQGYSYSQIAKMRGIENKSSICKVVKSSKKRIIEFLETDKNSGNNKEN